MFFAVQVRVKDMLLAASSDQLSSRTLQDQCGSFSMRLGTSSLNPWCWCCLVVHHFERLCEHCFLHWLPPHATIFFSVNELDSLWQSDLLKRGMFSVSKTFIQIMSTSKSVQCRSIPKRGEPFCFSGMVKCSTRVWF